jgi:hypothetical protein
MINDKYDKFKALELPQVEELINKARAYKLDNVEIIDKFTLTEAQRVYNGVGPDSFPAELRDALSDVNIACLPAVLIHDLEYVTGGTKDEFAASNRRLKVNMRKCVKENYSIFNPFYWWYWFEARVFSKLCQKFGFSGWALKEAAKPESMDSAEV